MPIVKAFLLLYCAVIATNAATAPIAINIVGKGVVRGATNAQILTIDRAYVLTATAGSGFVFRGWTGSTNSAKASLSFRMQPDFALTATFEDVTRPSVAIFKPKANQRLLTNEFLMGGQAKDNDRVKEVQVRLNGGSWTNAWGTTFWEAPVTLTPGLNRLEVFSTDYANKNSATGAVNVTYVVCEPVQFNVSGPGKISPTPATCYEIGKTYTVTAIPRAGCVFDGWSGSTNTTSRVLKFQMRSGFAFTATFRDLTKPTISVTSPAKSGETPNAEFTIVGRASDNIAVSKVFWSANGGEWNEATGTTSWNVTVALEKGPNRVRVYSQDTSGNVSPTREFSIMSVRELARVYFPLSIGDQWTYLDSFGRFRKEVVAHVDGQVALKDIAATISETYYKFSDDFARLTNYGGNFEPMHLTMIPPFVEQDQKLLAHGGTTTIQSRMLLQDPSLPGGQRSVLTKFVFKITVVPEVTVPAGVFKDCRRMDISATGYFPELGWEPLSRQIQIMAPNVGPIQLGPYRKLNNGTFQFLEWIVLERAIINGNPIGFSEPALAMDVPETTPTSETINTVLPALLPKENTKPLSPVKIAGSVPAASVILGVPILNSDRFGFAFTTEAGRKYRVQASYDLLNWGELISFTAQDSEYEFADPETTDAYRFYRVIAE